MAALSAALSEPSTAASALALACFYRPAALLSCKKASCKLAIVPSSFLNSVPKCKRALQSHSRLTPCVQASNLLLSALSARLRCFALGAFPPTLVPPCWMHSMHFVEGQEVLSVFAEFIASISSFLRLKATCLMNLRV